MSEIPLKDRYIFAYFDPYNEDSDQDGMVHVDPFIIQDQWERAWDNAKVDLDAEFSVLANQAEGWDGNGPDPLWKFKKQSMANVVPFLHEVFGTKPWDSRTRTGLTIQEAHSNLFRWNVFNDDLKKSTGDVPNSPTFIPEPEST